MAVVECYSCSKQKDLRPSSLQSTVCRIVYLTIGINVNSFSTSHYRKVYI
jgi:hypothetical protein